MTVCILKSGTRNIGTLFYLTTHITVHFWQAALNGQTLNTVFFFLSENFDCVLHRLLKHKSNVNFVFILEVNLNLSLHIGLLQFLSLCCLSFSLEVD